MTLSVVHPDRPGTLAGDSYWLYADDDLAGYARIARVFGEQRRLLEPAAFQAGILETSGAFLQWVDRALDDCPPGYWIAASFFKDMVCTPMFLHLACLRMAVHAGSQGRNVVVVTRSAALAGQIRQNSGSRGALSGWGSGDTLLAWARTWGHFFYRPCFVYASAVLAKWVIGSRYRARLNGVQLLVDTFVFPEDIRADGRYSDRFFPGLVEWYRARGIEAASMPFTGHIPLRKLRAVYRRMRASSIPFAPGELFLGIADCVAGARSALRAFMRPPGFAATPFLGIPIAALATHWWRRSAFQTVAYQILRRVPRRMAEHGLKPGYALDWYEQQPLDTAITLGFREAGAGTTVIAGRQYFPTAGVVNLFSTPGAVRAGAAPELNWACGRRIAELFAAHDGLGRYEVTPALRYAHLFEATGSTEDATKLLVFLTSSPAESMSMLECIFSTTPAARAGFETIIIKTHQALRGNLRAEAERRWPAMREPRVVWDQRTTWELLDEAKLVLTAGSSVAVEAVCRGVPVVVVGSPAGIVLNPLENIDARLWRVAYGPQDFEHIMQHWLPSVPDGETRREIGRNIRDQYLEATTAETMRAFELPQR